MNLRDAKVVGFVPITDARRARRFYEEALGLRVVDEDDFAIVVDANGTTVRLTKIPAWTPPQHTVLGWQVADVTETVRALRARGVAFERYDFLEQDADGVWTAPGGAARIAWLKDPDGNVLSVQS